MQPTTDRACEARTALPIVAALLVERVDEIEREVRLDYAALFTGGQHAAGLRTILADLGYPQPPTTILCDNTTAIGLANDNIKMKRSKAMDMRFHWIRDRVRRNQFYLVYIPTKENIADYMTKNLPKKLHDRFIFYLVRDTSNAATQCLIAQRRL